MVTRGFLLSHWVTEGSGRWYIAARGHSHGHTMTDMTMKESPWAEVLPLAEKILRLVDENAPKEALNISPGFHSHMLSMFVRAYRLYEGVLVLLKAELPEESMFLARSLFEDSLCLHQCQGEADGSRACCRRAIG